jgi:hypothetical protein
MNFALGVIASSIRKIGGVTPAAPAPAGFAMDAYTSVLMHLDTADFIDEAGHVFTNDGGTVGIVADAASVGGYAASFDGASYLHTPRTPNLVFGTDSFTVEFFLRTTYAGFYQYLMFAYAGGAQDWYIYLDNNGGLNFNGGGTVTASAPFTDGARRHIAFVYDSTTTHLSIFVNGTRNVSSAISANFVAPFVNLKIGGSDPDVTTANKLRGTLDELRVSKGIARYTENFTPLV